MKIIERILRAKHWQLFLVTIGIPFSIHIISMIILFVIFINYKNTDFSNTFIIVIGIIFILLMLAGLVSSSMLYAWNWAIGIGLQEKLPIPLRSNTRYFKLCFLYPIIHVLLLFPIFIVALVYNINTKIEPIANNIILLYAIFLPFHLMAMACMFYNIYFAARTFKTTELQRKTTFSDFAGEFFLIWFYPIGIWIIQPKINRMIDEKSEFEEYINE